MTLIVISMSALWVSIAVLLYDFYYRPMPDRVIRKFRTLHRVIKIWVFRNSDPAERQSIDRWLYERRGQIDDTDPQDTARMLLHDFASIQAVEVLDGSMTEGCMMRR